MAKWREPDQDPRIGDIRAVNYIAGVDEDGNEIWKHRLDQYNEWGWQHIPVYDEQVDGTLVKTR